MPDEHSERMVRLLEEIRDLTKERNARLEALAQAARQRAEDAVERQKEAQLRLLAQRRRFLWTLIPLLLLAIGFMAYLGFWVIPNSEQRDADRWMEQMRMIDSNRLSQPR